MPNQDGLRFLFDIQDKISAKLAKIEAKAKASAKNIDKAFTRASKSQQTNSAKAIASEQRRIVAVEKSHARAIKLLQRESDEFKRSMGRMASAATVAFAAVAGKAIQMAGGYDLAMRSVQAKTGATGDLMDRLSEQSREMGRTTVHSATEAARGQAFLAQAGFDVHEVLEALPATLALATSGELDLASAADIASNVLSGFRLETDQAARVADVLAKAADSSNTNVAQLGAALAKAAPSAAAAKWSLEETAAAIGKLSDAGIQGEEAGTALKTMMAKLAIDGGPAERLMAKMGITVKDTTTGAMLPLNDILTALAPHANDVGLQFELLGTRGGNAGLVLGAVAQDAAVLTEELIDSAGWAQKNADIMAGGLWGALKAIASIVDSAYISLGERFTPAIKTLAGLFKKLPNPIQEVVVVVGSLAGAMGGLMLMMPNVFGAITRLPGKLVALNAKIGVSTWSVKGLTLAIKNAWRALMGPVGWVIAITAATVALYKFWKATNSPDKKLAKFESDLEAVNRRLLEFADSSPGLVKALGSQKAALERQIAALKKSHPELEQAEEDLAALADTSEDLAAVIDGDLIPAIEELTEAEQKAAQKIIDIARDKRMAIVAHIHLRREAERAANDARVKGEADAAQAIVDIEAAKRRAIVLHIQKRREALRDAELEAAEAADKAAAAADKATAANQRFALSLALIAGQVGGPYGQALNQMSAMMKAVDEDGKRTFTNMQAGVAGFGAALSVAGSEMGGYGGIAVETLGNVASALAKGDWIGAAIAGLTGLGKALDRAFNGAQMAFNDLTDTIKDSLDAIRDGSLSAAEAWDKATNWEGNEEGYERLRDTQALWAEVGLSAEEATNWTARFNAANKNMDAEGLKALLVEYENIARAAELMNDAIAATISAFDRAKKAGTDAYDKVYLAAIESGLSQEEAIRKATAAQEKASAKILAIEKKKFIRIARFEAALEAIRSGNAEGAADAADKAAREVAEAWEISLKAVTQADSIASQAMQKSSAATADKAVDEAARMAKGVRDALDRIPTHRTVNIDYFGQQTGSHGGDDPPGRAAGGPVLAGHRYRVGERGPEDFIPSRSGRIEPNGSSGGGGVDAKELAKAVSAGLDGAQIKVDGRQLGRLVVRHQPLAVAELGGRR